MTIGVVTGMVSEAKLLEGLGYRVIAGGGHAQATRAKTERLVKEGVTALLASVLPERSMQSCGLAISLLRTPSRSPMGGLSPAMLLGASV